MSAEIINLDGTSRTTTQSVEQWPGVSMQRALFRSYRLILETDDDDLIRSVRLDIDKARSKLKRLQERKSDLQQNTAAELARLDTADTKLTAAIVAALLLMARP